METIDETPEGEKFDYLRPKETITYSIDSTYNITLIEINFDGWFENSVRLWGKNNEVEFSVVGKNTSTFTKHFFFFI